MTKTIPVSRFIQSYNQHLSDAERTGETIVLQQRAGRTAWVLEAEGQVRATQEATGFLAAALAAVASDESLAGKFPEALTSTLPWTAFLPEEDRREFAAEAAESLKACASIGKYAAFAHLVAEWRNTAEIFADPDLARSLSASVENPVDLPVDDS